MLKDCKCKFELLLDRNDKCRWLLLMALPGLHWQKLSFISLPLLLRFHSFHRTGRYLICSQNHPFRSICLHSVMLHRVPFVMWLLIVSMIHLCMSRTPSLQAKKPIVLRISSCTISWPNSSTEISGRFDCCLAFGSLTTFVSMGFREETRWVAQTRALQLTWWLLWYAELRATSTPLSAVCTVVKELIRAWVQQIWACLSSQLWWVNSTRASYFCQSLIPFLGASKVHDYCILSTPLKSSIVSFGLG